MLILRKYRIPALFCAVAVLVCELVSRPFTNIGICDDGPYILMARTLASTGHIVYNGGTAAMLAFQLYLAVAFIKLFGFSFTIVRMSTLLVSTMTAFALQRTLVRAGINERNATLGTLALVLSPLYLMLSVTFMSDITGMFAIVVCLYGCLRALQAPSDQSAIAWLCLAVVANGLGGTSRQIAWLGILIMIPATIWILRGRRRVIFGGTAAVFAGVLFIYLCIHWLKRQPYVIPIPLLVKHFPIGHVMAQLIFFLLGIPFLLLPIFASFLPQLNKSRRRSILAVSSSVLIYLVLALSWGHGRRLLEPTSGNTGSWIGVHGIYEGVAIRNGIPLFLPVWLQAVLTAVCLCALAALVASVLRLRRSAHAAAAHVRPSWNQLGLLSAPFTVAYIGLLIANAGSTQNHDLYDRYVLGLLVVALPCCVRFYQDCLGSRLPSFTTFAIGVMALYGIFVTHNLFALQRARSAINDEIAAQGVSALSVDNGWDYNFDVELQYASHINDPRIKMPSDSYAPVAPPEDSTCQVFWYDRTPRLHPVYSVSSDPDACYGPASFAPVYYSRWPFLRSGVLYVVRFSKLGK